MLRLYCPLMSKTGNLILFIGCTFNGYYFKFHNDKNTTYINLCKCYFKGIPSMWTVNFVIEMLGFFNKKVHFRPC